MAQDFAKPFYRNKAWRKTRQAYWESHWGLCELCGGVGEEVHHRIVLTPQNVGNPEITLNWNNLTLLCRPCHVAQHSSQSIPTGLAFDENGQLVKVGKEQHEL